MASLHIRNDFENAINPSTIKSTKSLQAAAPSKFSKSIKDLIAQKRSFSDISNRVGRTSALKTKGHLKEKHLEGKCEQIQKEGSNSKGSKEAVKEKVISKTLTQSDYQSPFPEFDFRPEIKECEDYGDVMPDRYKLSDKTISEFVRFWNQPSRFVNPVEREISSTPSFDLHSPCNSPTKSSSHFELIPTQCHNISPQPLERMSDEFTDEDLGVFLLPPSLA